MSTGYYAVWCEKCATRLQLATEETEDESRGVDALTPGLDMQASTPCPVCGGKLLDVDELVAFDELPFRGWKEEDEPELHAKLRARRAEQAAKKSCS